MFCFSFFEKEAVYIGEKGVMNITFNVIFVAFRFIHSFRYRFRDKSSFVDCLTPTHLV